MASRDFSFEIASAATQLALTLSRFAQDMHVYVSHEFSAVSFPDSVCGTSSIMPQKKNPVVLEHLKGKAAHVLAALMSMGACVKASHFTNTLDAHREGQALIWPGLAEAGRAVTLARIAVEAVEPAAELLLDRARANYSTATELADLLVRDAGQDFRTAHHVAGAVVRRLMDAGLGAHQATLATVDEASQEVAGTASGLSAIAVEAALDPARAVRGRTVQGGTAPAAMADTVARLRTALAADQQWTQDRRTALAQAAAAREAAVKSLLPK